MNKYTRFFEDLLKVLAAISLILLIAAYIDLKTYYRFFGINISNYISTSEIIISSIDNLALVLFSLLLQLLLWLFFFDHLFDYTEKDVDEHFKGKLRPAVIFDNDLSMERFIKSKKIRLIIISLLILTAISITTKNIFPKSVFATEFSPFVILNFWIFTSLYLIFLPITRFLWKVSKKQEEYHPKMLVSFIVFLSIFMGTIWIKSHFEANRIRKYGNSENVEIILKDSLKIFPNDSIRYIGKTENYIFFWNKKTWTSTIYPVGDIKQIIQRKWVSK